MSHKRDPFPIGPMAEAGIEILEHIARPDGVLPNYRVRCLSCGCQSIMTHETTRSRMYPAQTRCRYCANKSHRRHDWQPGPLPQARLTILGEAPRDSSGKRRYGVRWDCCGREGIIGLAAILERIREGRKTCWACFTGRGQGESTPQEAQQGEVPSVSRPQAQPDPDRSIHLMLAPSFHGPAGAWPRPPGLASRPTQPWVQEAIWGTP